MNVKTIRAIQVGREGKIVAFLYVECIFIVDGGISVVWKCKTTYMANIQQKIILISKDVVK